jgi:hypothetical protein
LLELMVMQGADERSPAGSGPSKLSNHEPRPTVKV